MEEDEELGECLWGNSEVVEEREENGEYILE